MVGYYYFVEKAYSTNNISLLVGAISSIIVCMELKKINLLMIIMIIIFGGACLGLDLWLIPITIIMLLFLRYLDYKEYEVSYIIAQMSVETGIILYIFVIAFAFTYLIEYAFFLKNKNIKARKFPCFFYKKTLAFLID